MASLQCLNASKFNMRRYVVKFKASNSVSSNEEKKLRILIAGGGIGGLVLALAAKNRGYDVKVFERDLSAVRGEGSHRGPIQLSSSALAVLQAIDQNVANRIMEAGCVTGDRINGVADGISGQWFTKFDLLTPALKRSLPITRTICRMELQDILVNSVGYDILSNKSKVVNFVEDSDKVTVILEDGRQYDGDILVGADGIWSEVRMKLFGKQEARYSGYTCYSGITNIVPQYINSVGYRVFIGLNQYFVASDVGNGKMQWYAFYKQPPMKTDPPGGKHKRLLELFGHWCDEVVTLITKTMEDKILGRDIYDRDMMSRWGVGRVTLLGDAAHPMQPNLGQGGCMAIEDCYQLVLELDKIVKTGSEEIVSALTSYEKKRRFRVSIVHAASRMASKMLSTYRPYIEFGSGPISRITNPTLHIARAFLQLCLPLFMTWIIAAPWLWVVVKEEKKQLK
ncbi:zeaxanthin epoxidase, chloroplastic-like [Pistacia vera]|uniref:zeaxanthin epoxidase, chloroplastic-like n=1 Tax=Pistacia vera TaxID=55513 RepID=UPI001263DEE0|nr:zeaxanthin epoxidase, chloroplastic-like [Pistacia vera]